MKLAHPWAHLQMADAVDTIVICCNNNIISTLKVECPGMEVLHYLMSATLDDNSECSQRHILMESQTSVKRHYMAYFLVIAKHKPNLIYGTVHILLYGGYTP